MAKDRELFKHRNTPVDYNYLRFIQLLHTANDVSTSVLEGDCIDMEIHLAATQILISFLSTLIYIETTSTYLVGKFNCVSNPFLYISLECLNNSFRL